MKETRQQILECAEQMIRLGGYNGFSFRDIAQQVGIGSATVHHHFPTKEELSLAIIESCKVDFLTTLESSTEGLTTTQEKLETYCDLFINSFKESKAACPFGVLAGEAEKLPEQVRHGVTLFVENNIAWLEKIFSQDHDATKAKQYANMVLCSVEGAMSIANLKEDASVLVNLKKTLSSFLTQ